MVAVNNIKRLFGWIGLICWLLIIPVKAIRWTDLSAVTSTIVDIAPSILGPAGLFFIILSSSNSWLMRRTLLQKALLAGAVAITLEFIQLLLRPGILERVYYTFDWLDVAGTLFSITVGYIIALRLSAQRK